MEIITDEISKYDQKWWDSFYAKHTHEMSETDKLHFEKAAEIIGNSSVLDVGCGEGRFSQFVSNYTGTDWSKEALNKAKKRFPDKKFIDKVEGKYDYITLFEVFEHVENPKEFVENLRKNTKRIIVALPNGEFGKIVMDNDEELMKTISKYTKYHYATYTENDIKEMFPEAEFIEVDPNHLMFIL